MALLSPRGTRALRGIWSAAFFYVAVRAAYPLLMGVAAAFGPLPRLAYPLGLAAVLLLASWLFLALERRPFRTLGLDLGPAWAAQFGLGLLGGAAIIAATAALACAAGGVRLVRNPSAGPGVLLAGAWAYLLPALNEELTFRGFLFQRLARALGPRSALVLLSLLFAAAHLPNPGMTGPAGPLALLNIFLAGVILGLAYLGTRSLALPTGLHLAWNWSQGTVLGFQVSGTPARGFLEPVLGGGHAWLTGGSFGLEGSLACTVVCLVAIGLSLRFAAPSRLAAGGPQGIDKKFFFQ